MTVLDAINYNLESLYDVLTYLKFWSTLVDLLVNILDHFGWIKVKIWVKKVKNRFWGWFLFRYSRSQRVLDRFRRYKLQLKEFIWCSDIFEILVNTCWPVGHHIGPFRMGKGQIISAHLDLRGLEATKARKAEIYQIITIAQLL